MINRIHEAEIFLKAFQKERTRQFLYPFLLNNYTQAICYHYPGVLLDKKRIKKQTAKLLDHIFNTFCYTSPPEVFPHFHRLSRNNPKLDPVWFPEFIDAYKNYKHKRKLFNRYQQLMPHLNGSSYCDIGCGGGDLVQYILQQHVEFTKAAGIDTMDWRTPEIKSLIDFQMLDFTLKDSSSSISYDTLTCLAVLHHTGRMAKDMVNFLTNLKTAMNPKGILIIEEDVILPRDEIADLVDISTQLDQLSENQTFLSLFISMSYEEQRDIIIAIDFIANCLSVGVPDMPFPCGFQTIRTWLEIFEKVELKLVDVSIHGFVQNNFNQSSHVFFILEKS